MKKKLRKWLSAPGLLEATRDCFVRLQDPLAGETKYPQENCLMSALAMFSLKYPSLLQFEHSQEDEVIRYNLKTLYGVEQVPCDTYLRERLDTVNPESLSTAFKACFSAVQRAKQLPLYTHRKRRYEFLAYKFTRP